MKKEQENVPQEKRIQLMEYRNGIYQGMMHPNQQRTNLGLFTWDSGEVYFGEWKHDMLDGEGILFFPYGGFIHGFFMKNKLNGAAFFKFSNGDIYEGFWRNGKLEGNCYKYFTDEERWILSDYKNGEFKRIISKGEGQPPSYVFNYITSTVDIATKHQSDTFLLDGLKIEAINFNDGGQYLGLVKNSMPTSLGIFKYSDGKFDVGNYNDGNLDGLGRLNLHNGDVYDGYLSNGQFNGLGLFFQKQSCSWIYGNFQNNKCVNIIKKGQGQFPIDIIEKFRKDHHIKQKSFIDRMTPLDVYSAPLYNQIPVDPEKHNFYLDLSITNPQIMSNNHGAANQFPIDEPFSMKQVLPKDLTSSNYQSPIPKRKQSKGQTVQNQSKLTNSVSPSVLKNTKERMSSKSKGKKQQQQDSTHIQKKSIEKNPTTRQEYHQKQNTQSPQMQFGRLDRGTSGIMPNQSSIKKSPLKKSQSSVDGSNKQRSHQSSALRNRNDKQEIDRQKTNNEDNIMDQYQDQMFISQSQGIHNLNFDEEFNTESSPRSHHTKAVELKTNKSLAQMIGIDQSYDPNQITYQKSESMATFHSKKSSLASSHKQSANLHEIGNVSKISGIGQSDTSEYKEKIKESNNQNQFKYLKPNIFGKKANDKPQQQMQEQLPIRKQDQSNNDNDNDQQSDSESSFSSYTSDKVVRKQTAPSVQGRTQIPMIKEEERMRSYSGTPANRLLDSDQKQKTSQREHFSGKVLQEGIKSQRSEQEKREQKEEEEDNKQFLEAEALLKQGEESNPIHPSAIHNKNKSNDDNEVYGLIKIKDFINLQDNEQLHQKSNRGDQSITSDSPAFTRIITIPSQQSQYKSNKDITTKQSIIPDNSNKGVTSQTRSDHQDGNIDETNLYQLPSKKCNKTLEIENISKEIDNYQNIVEQSIPQRRKKSKITRKETSRESSSHARTPQSLGTTPKQFQSVSPNFQQSPILTTLHNPKIQYQPQDYLKLEADDLELEESEVVLDSIKLIKEQMINQLKVLENKQNEVSTPVVSNFKYNIVPNLKIPNEENQILKDYSNQDISPQNPIENYDSPFKNDSIVHEKSGFTGRGRSANQSRLDKSRSRSQKYYTEEEANLIAERIERNLVSQGEDETQQKQEQGSSQSRNDLLYEGSAQVNDMIEQLEIHQQLGYNRQEIAVRSKQQNEPEFMEIQYKEVEESLEQTGLSNKQLNVNQQLSDGSNPKQRDNQQDQDSNQQLIDISKQQTNNSQQQTENNSQQQRFNSSEQTYTIYYQSHVISKQQDNSQAQTDNSQEQQDNRQQQRDAIQKQKDKSNKQRENSQEQRHTIQEQQEKSQDIRENTQKQQDNSQEQINNRSEQRDNTQQQTNKSQDKQRDDNIEQREDNKEQKDYNIEQSDNQVRYNASLEFRGNESQEQRDYGVQTSILSQNNQMIQTQTSMKTRSAQTSPLSQSPTQRKESTINQSNIPHNIVIEQKIDMIKEDTTQTSYTDTLHQNKLCDNLIQSTITQTIPIIETNMVDPINQEPSTQSSQSYNQQQITSSNYSNENNQAQKLQNTLIPQQVVGQIYSLLDESPQFSQYNKVFSEKIQDKITQAVNEQWQQKNPELFKNITPMEFCQSIVQRQNHFKELSPEELKQLEYDIQDVKRMKNAEDLQQIINSVISSISSPHNISQNDDIKNFTFQDNENSPQVQQRKSQVEDNQYDMNSAKNGLDQIIIYSEQARKEQQVQQQQLQSHLSLSQNNQIMTQQQQKEIEELKKQQDEFIKQQIIIQKQQADYLEKLQQQQAMIIQQGEEQRRHHEEEKQRQIKEIEALDEQRNQRIKEEERLKQLREMQENIRKQIEDDLTRKKGEDEDHSRRQQTLFDKEQQILARLQDEQEKLSRVQSEQARMESKESENKRVRELQLQFEEENRQREIIKLEELKREAAALYEEQRNNKNKTEQDTINMHQQQIKYAEEQRKQQEILDQLNQQKLVQESALREQDINKQQELLDQQRIIQEQQFALQQDQLRIQRERQELEILLKKRNEESYLSEQQSLSKIAAKEQEVEQLARLKQETLLIQQEELQRQKQLIENQKLELIQEQERLNKQSLEENLRLKQAEITFQETLKAKQQVQEQEKLVEIELQTKLKEEYLITQQEELQRQKQIIENQKLDFQLEQDRLFKKAKEEEEKRVEAERLLQETLIKKQIEEENAIKKEQEIQARIKEEAYIAQQEELQLQRQQIENQKQDLLIEQERLRKKAKEEEEKRQEIEIILQESLKTKQQDEENARQQQLQLQTKLYQEAQIAQQESFKAQQQELQLQKQQIESQRLELILEQDRLNKKVKEEEEKRIEAERLLQETMIKKQIEEENAIKKEQEIQTRIKEEAFIAQQEELLLQRQQIENQKQDLLIEQERLRKKAKEEEEKRKEIERVLQESLKAKQQDEENARQYQLQLQAKLNQEAQFAQQESYVAQQQELQQQKLQIESQKLDLILEQDRLNKKVKEEEEKRNEIERVLEETIRQQKQEQEKVSIEQQHILKQAQIKLEIEQQELKRQNEENIRKQQEQIQLEKDEIDNQRQALAQMERDQVQRQAIIAKSQQQQQQKEEQEQVLLKKQEEIRQTNLMKVEAISNNLDSRREYVLPQSSLEFNSNQGGVASSSNNNSNQSLNASPINNLLDTDTMIKESKAHQKIVIDMPIPQTHNLSQNIVPNTFVNQEILFEPKEREELVKRLVFTPQKDINNNYSNNNNNNPSFGQDSMTHTDMISLQKNVDMFNQIDKVIRSSSHSAQASPINTIYGFDNEVTKRVHKKENQSAAPNTFQHEIIQSNQSEKNDALERAYQVYNQIIAPGSIVQEIPNFNQISSISNKDEKSITLQDYNPQKVSEESSERGEITNKNFLIPIISNIKNDTLDKQNILANTSYSLPISQPQNSSISDNNLINQKVSGVSDYAPLLNKSQQSAPSQILPTLGPKVKLEVPELAQIAQINENLPQSVAYIVVPQNNPSLPISRQLQSSNYAQPQSQSLTDRVTNNTQENQKEIHKQIDASKQQKITGEIQVTKAQAEQSSLNANANFDIRSSISSIQRDPLLQTNYYTGTVGSGLQPIPSWKNPASINSSGGSAAFLGIPIPAQTVTPSQQNQNVPTMNVNQSLYASFGNEKNHQNNYNNYQNNIDRIGNKIIISNQNSSNVLNSSFGKQPQTTLIGEQNKFASSIRSSYHGDKIIVPATIASYTTSSNPTLTQKLPISINTASITGVNPYIPITTQLISPRSQELNQYRISTTPTSTIIPSSSRIVGTTTLPQSSSVDKNVKQSIISDAAIPADEDVKHNNNNNDSKFLNTLNSSAGFIGYKKKIRIQASPQVIKETHLPMINNNNNNSRNSSIFQQNNSFSHSNHNASGIVGANQNNHVFLNNSFNNSFSIQQKGIVIQGSGNNNHNKNNNSYILNTSLTEDQPKQARNYSEQPHKQGGILRNAVSSQKQSQFNSPISMNNQSQQNSIIRLHRGTSPGSDTSLGSVSLIKKTNVTVVHTPETRGAVSLVRAIQDTYTYTEPASNDDSFNNSSFNNNNKSILDSQASQYLQQTINMKEMSPIRKKIIIQKSDRLNMNSQNIQQKYYERNQAILEDVVNEEVSPTNRKQSEKGKKKAIGSSNISGEVIDEQEENMCNVF